MELHDLLLPASVTTSETWLVKKQTQSIPHSLKLDILTLQQNPFKLSIHFLWGNANMLGFLFQIQVGKWPLVAVFQIIVI